MASRDLDRTLRELSALRSEPHSDATQGRLREALCDRSPAIVAKAAALAGEFELVALSDDLVSVFDQFLSTAGSDRGCVAKVALADALYRIGCDDPGPFLRGIRHVQRDSRNGADTAAGLRGVCAMGLVRIGHADVLEEIAELLADPDPSARLAAVRALAYRDHESSAPLLRLKAGVGDSDSEVTAEALAALLKVSGARALEFVSKFLGDANPALAEAAALALGSARIPEAFEVLTRFHGSARDADLRQSCLNAVATLRDDRALEFLIELVNEAPGPTAREAIRALGLFRGDEALAKRVRQIAENREDVDLTADIAKEF